MNGREGNYISGSPPPKGGVVLLYENVKVTISNGRVGIFVTHANGSESGTIIDQNSGQVVGESKSD